MPSAEIRDREWLRKIAELSLEGSVKQVSTFVPVQFMSAACGGWQASMHALVTGTACDLRREIAKTFVYEGATALVSDIDGAAAAGRPGNRRRAWVRAWRDQ
jgi:hypothetical protein